MIRTVPIPPADEAAKAVVFPRPFAIIASKRR
jgi:hypothetical protein